MKIRLRDVLASCLSKSTRKLALGEGLVGLFLVAVCMGRLRPKWVPFFSHPRGMPKVNFKQIDVQVRTSSLHVHITECNIQPRGVTVVHSPFYSCVLSDLPLDCKRGSW